MIEAEVRVRTILFLHNTFCYFTTVSLHIKHSIQSAYNLTQSTMCIPCNIPSGGFQASSFTLNQLLEMNSSSSNAAQSPSQQEDTTYAKEFLDLDTLHSNDGLTHQDYSEEDDAYYRHCVKHNYHDHARDDGALYLGIPVVCKGGVTIPFPTKLHDMLNHIALHETELSDIISWQPHGRCFLVKKPKQFTKSVLPRFFDQRKYASFQRQLNLYGFSRITTGSDRGSYYHELFLRTKRILCRGIQRKKIKGTGTRMASNPEQEPNFYILESMPSAGTDSPPPPTLISRTIKPDPHEHAPSRGRDGYITPPTPYFKEEEEQGDCIGSMPPLDLSSVQEEEVEEISSTITPTFANDNHGNTTEEPLANQPAPSWFLYPETEQPQQQPRQQILQEDEDDTRFVFDGMQFHTLDFEKAPINSRNSFILTSVPPPLQDQQQEQIIVDDTLPFDDGMNFLSDVHLTLDLNDREIVDILDKIVDNDDDISIPMR